MLTTPMSNQPAPPADPRIPPPEPLAPVLWKRFAHQGLAVSIVQQQEITCCGRVTPDDRFEAVLGDWTPGYAYETSYSPDRPDRPGRVHTWRTIAEGGEVLVTHRHPAKTADLARAVLTDRVLLAEHGPAAREHMLAYPPTVTVGPAITNARRGQVVAAEWGGAWWRAVVAEALERRVRVVLCHHPEGDGFTRLLTVGREVRAIHEQPRGR